MSNYIQMVKPYINNRHLYFVDRGDIVKKDNTKFENKGFVLDDRTLNEAYMVLLTSRTISGKAQALQIVRDYALRWKIEENFKYKKQQFYFEKIKVRRYKRIQVLNTLLTYVMFFSNVINLKAIGKTIRKIKNQIRDKILFWLYRISDGIKEIISFFSAELLSILYPSRNK